MHQFEVVSLLLHHLLDSEIAGQLSLSIGGFALVIRLDRLARRLQRSDLVYNLLVAAKDVLGLAIFRDRLGCRLELFGPRVGGNLLTELSGFLQDGVKVAHFCAFSDW